MFIPSEVAELLLVLTEIVLLGAVPLTAALSPTALISELEFNRLSAV